MSRSQFAYGVIDLVGCYRENASHSIVCDVYRNQAFVLLWGDPTNADGSQGEDDRRPIDIIIDQTGSEWWARCRPTPTPTRGPIPILSLVLILMLILTTTQDIEKDGSFRAWSSASDPTQLFWLIISSSHERFMSLPQRSVIIPVPVFFRRMAGLGQSRTVPSAVAQAEAATETHAHQPPLTPLFFSSFLWFDRSFPFLFIPSSNAICGLTLVFCTTAAATEAAAHGRFQVAQVAFRRGIFPSFLYYQ